MTVQAFCLNLTTQLFPPQLRSFAQRGVDAALPTWAGLFEVCDHLAIQADANGLLGGFRRRATQCFPPELLLFFTNWSKSLELLGRQRRIVRVNNLSLRCTPAALEQWHGEG